MLTAAIGAAAGLLAAQVPARHKPGLAACIAVGVTGAILAGFILPQVGAPVSTSLAMGLITSALGAAIPLAALVGWRIAAFHRLTRLRLCCLAFRFAGVLCLADGVLVLISMPLARQATISAMTATVSTVVAVFFALAALLTLRIGSQVSAIGHLQLPESIAAQHAELMRRLLTSLLLAGTAFSAMMGLLMIGLLGRIGEGFAIFG